MPQASYPPELSKSEFNCAHCGVFAAQVWYVVAGRQGNWRQDQKNPQPHSFPCLLGGTHHFAIEPFNTTQNGKKVGMSVGGQVQALPKGEDDLLLHDYYISVCFHCAKPSLWNLDKMVCPSQGGIESPNLDLDEDIRADYLEAASVVQQSPRAAAALLRLCVQKLTKQLGLQGKNINEDIAALVARGLNPDIQQALDTVRVIGNNAVHPLEMDMKDNRQIANALFALVNFIADQMITFPAKRAALFASLPQAALSGIAKRDSA
ncbi:MAG: DUF4145 domain-containing protein [Thiobacillus sp.]